MRNTLHLRSMCTKSIHDLQVLHHQVKGAMFYTIHPLLGEYYDTFGKYFDTLTEIGITLGIPEQSIRESLANYPNDVEIAEVYGKAAMEKACEIMKTAFDMMTAAEEEVPGDVVSTLQGYEGELRIATLYMQQAFLTKL